MCLKKGGGRLTLLLDKGTVPQVLMYQEKGGKCSHFFPLDKRTVLRVFMCQEKGGRQPQIQLGKETVRRVLKF
jgi:hypothetical protein